MILNWEQIYYDPQIDFIGFNIKNGNIISEKIYYKKEKEELQKIDHPFIKHLLAITEDLRYFSIESYHAQQGTVKYDFQVETEADWINALQFLKENAPFFDYGLVAEVERISWLRTMFSTLSIRIVGGIVSNIIIYYKRPPQKRAQVCQQLRKILPAPSCRKCAVFMRLLFSQGAWVRLVAIDFYPKGEDIKIYFETENPELVNTILMSFEMSDNYLPLAQIIDYATHSNLLFRGIAIVMNIQSDEIRYNLYFVQKRPE